VTPLAGGRRKIGRHRLAQDLPEGYPRLHHLPALFDAEGGHGGGPFDVEFIPLVFNTYGILTGSSIAFAAGLSEVICDH
jgi:hypothetical protein